MNINELDQLISDDIESFKTFVQSEHPEYSREPVTSEDLAEFGKQTYYALDCLRRHIIKYLSQQ